MQTEIKNIYELDSGLTDAQKAELAARSLRGESAGGFTEEQIEARKKADYEFDVECARSRYLAEQREKKEVEEKETQRKAKQDERDRKRRLELELKQANIAHLNQQIVSKAKREADAACVKLLTHAFALSTALSRLKPGDFSMPPAVREKLEELLNTI